MMHPHSGVRQQNKSSLPPIAGDIIILPTVDSTQKEARRLLCNGQKAPFTIISEFQTDGVGRFRRRWHSPPGGIYLTWCIDNPGRHGVSLLVAVALKIALEEYFGAKFIVKWPNDILKDGKKVAGILVESDENLLLVGVGINTFSRRFLDEQYSPRADTLEINSEERICLVIKLFQRLDEFWKRFYESGLGFIRDMFLSCTFDIGTPMKLREGNRMISGEFAGIGEDGDLILKTDSGVFFFRSGESTVEMQWLRKKLQ